MYVALRRLKVGDGWREPGDPVPEAATWRNLRAYLGAGQVAEVPDEESAGAEPTAPARPRRRPGRAAESRSGMP